MSGNRQSAALALRRNGGLAPAGGRMHSKARFWSGMSLGLGGIVVIMASGVHLAGHLAGVGVVLAGLLLAVRNARH